MHKTCCDESGHGISISQERQDHHLKDESARAHEGCGVMRLHHEEPQTDVRSAKYPLRGEKKKRSTGGRRVEDGVLGEVGYAGLKVCHQVYHCLETDTMAAIHGDDITAEGEPEKLDCLDEILKQLVVVRSARQQKA